MSKDVNYMIEVMTAYANGKKIESKPRTGGWGWCPKPSWNWHDTDYRVKEEPRYRPYESTDEMIEDFCKRTGLEPTSMLMPVIWIKEKNSNTKRLIVSFTGDYIYTHFGTELDDWSLNELFARFSYLDGSPVGKEAE